MSKPNCFSPNKKNGTMNIEEAQNISIVEYLKAIGITPTLVRGRQYWYCAPYRNETKPSLKVNMDRNRWYDFGTNGKGDLVELCKLLYRTAYIPDVLERISRQAELSHLPCTRLPVIKPHTTEKEITRVVVQELTHPALISYMRTRKIDAGTAIAYCREVHYVVRRKPYFAIAFPNNIGGYELRNSYFKGCIIAKDITTIKEADIEYQHVCVFEGFMDFLSYLVLRHKGDSNICIDQPTAFIVLNSVSNRDKAEAELEQYELVHCYLDNDLAGRLTTEALVKKLGVKVFDEAWRYEEYDDLNDYLRGKKR